jgi:hypothetical protein
MITVNGVTLYEGMHYTFGNYFMAQQQESPTVWRLSRVSFGDAGEMILTQLGDYWTVADAVQAAKHDKSLTDVPR